MRQTDDYSGGKWPCYKATRLLTSLNLSGLNFPPEKNEIPENFKIGKNIIDFQSAKDGQYPKIAPRCSVIGCEQGLSKMYGHVRSVNTHKHHINKHYYIMITFLSKTFFMKLNVP